MCRKTEVDSNNNNNNNRNHKPTHTQKTRMLINDKKQHRRVFALLGCCFKILELQTKTSGKKRKERPFSSVVVKRKIGNPGNNQKNLNVSFFLAIAVWVRNVAPRRQTNTACLRNWFLFEQAKNHLCCVERERRGCEWWSFWVCFDFDQTDAMVERKGFWMKNVEKDK